MAFLHEIYEEEGGWKIVISILAIILIILNIIKILN